LREVYRQAQIKKKKVIIEPTMQMAKKNPEKRSLEATALFERYQYAFRRGYMIVYIDEVGFKDNDTLETAWSAPK